MLGVRRECVVRVVTARKSYAGEERRFLGSSAATSSGSAGRRGISAAALGQGGAAMANEECAHCGVLISEWSTVAKREGKIFCCPNCANAHVGSQSASTDAAMPMPPRTG
jgi:hypothetical protein